MIYETIDSETGAVVHSTTNPISAMDYYHKHHEEEYDYHLNIKEPLLFCGDEVEPYDLAVALFVAFIERGHNFDRLAKRFGLQVGVALHKVDHESAWELADELLGHIPVQDVYYQTGKEPRKDEGHPFEIYRGDYHDDLDAYIRVGNYPYGGPYDTKSAASTVVRIMLKMPEYKYRTFLVLDKDKEEVYRAYNTFMVGGS